MAFISLAVSVLLGVAAAQPATTHFSSARGFSFDYPPGWVVGTEETRQVILTKYKSAFEKLGDVDFSRMAVMVFDPCDDEFVENVNVVISRGRMPINDESCRKLAEALPEQLRGGGLDATDMRTEIVTFGNRKAISNRWTVTGLAPGMTLRQWQIVMPGRNQTYIVTASATTASFPGYEARFRDILGSFRADSGVLGLWYSLPTIIQYAIIGGIIGGLVGGVRSLFKRKGPGTGGHEIPRGLEAQPRGEVK